MSSFQRIVSRESVLSFGISTADWDDDDQAYLHEAMILAWKENPDWTDEEATAACKNQVERIVYQNFKATYGRQLRDATNRWQSVPAAYDDYKKLGKKEFQKVLNEEAEFQEFCGEFYSDLREMYNICSAGLRNAFNEFKLNNWSFDDYRRDLLARRKKMGFSW